MKISIVIPNYNGEKLLRKNLPRVIRAAPNSAEIVIVDDVSDDGSVEYIKYQISKIKYTEQKLKIKLIGNKTNLGFSSTVNRGVREASGDLVVLLNTDVYPQEGFLIKALPHFKDPKVFAVGCLQLISNRKEPSKQGRGIGKFERGFLVHGPGRLDKKNTLWVFGGAGIFRKKIWQKLGGLDELYNPFYWEDIDLSYRALKASYKLVFEPESVIYHSQGESIRKAYSPYKIKTVAYRNQILFVWLNITDFSLLLEHLLFLPYHLFKAVVTFDHAFIVGFLQALTKLPKVANHRRRNKRFSKISDREILD